MILKSFELELSSYFGPGIYVYIDLENEKVIKYSQNMGSFPYKDIFSDEGLKNIDPDCTFFFEKFLEDKDIEYIQNKLLNLDIENWNEEYADNNICDGQQWHVMYNEVRNGEVLNRKIYGSNEYPDEWEQMIKLINKYLGYNLRKIRFKS